MSQRNSGYQRLPDEAYHTPEWVTHALRPHLRGVRTAWEPACGNGSIVRVLAEWGLNVRATDITTDFNFLKAARCQHDLIVTNPPYSLAQQFIEHALRLTKPQLGRVAMLLRVDFDSAVTRQHLFGGCRHWARKVVLTSRIRWIKDSTGSPSENHAWFIWDHKHDEPLAQVAYHYERETDRRAASLTGRLERLRERGAA